MSPHARLERTPPERDPDPAVPVSRRELLKGAGGLAAAALAGGCAPEPAGEPSGTVVELGDRILLRGGCVLTMDPQIGDFDRADVLIADGRISRVAPGIEAGSAEVVDASNMIVMPGFVDTHRHSWQGALRNLLPDGLLADYIRDILGPARSAYRPADVYIGDRVTALGALNAGVTTLLDWSHIGNSPDHTDAAISGLRDTGIRAVYAYGAGAPGPSSRFPGDIRRLRAEFFSADDQLLTLAMAAGMSASEWAVAREVGAPITVHAGGGQYAPVVDAMGPDVTYIHCTGQTDAEWRRIADTGGRVSIACPIEMKMGHGIPPIQAALDHGIRPSLSVDVETEMPGDLFNQMRAVLTLQRMQANARAGEADAPRLLGVRDVVGFATIEGARTNGLEARIGSLTPGKDADVILLRTDRINVMPLNNAYGAVVLGMDTSNVDSVLVRGEFRKRGGELVDVDLSRVETLVTESRDYILREAGWPDTRLGGYLPGH